MPHWLLDLALLIVIWLAARVALGAVFDSFSARERRLGRAVVRLVLRSPAADVVPLHRPIEQVAADARRLRRSFHHDVMPFAKYEGCRQAYDAALAEAAKSLGLDHRLDTLRPGTHRDLERQRVERMLERAGLLPPLRAA